MIKQYRLRLTIRILQLGQTKFWFKTLPLWFFITIKLSRSSLDICNDFFPVVHITQSSLTWHNLLLHRIKETTFPDVNRLFWTPTDKIITLTTEFCIVWMRFQCVLQLSFLRIPNLCCSILGRWNQVRAMWVEIDWFYWSLMPFVDLYYVLWS